MNSPTLLTRRPALHSAVAILLMTTFMSGCAPVSPTANQDRALFDRLCNATDRDFINFTATGKGYAEARSSDSALACPDVNLFPDVFTEMGYQFYECVQGTWEGEDNLTSKTYRFSLEEKGSALCEMRNDRVKRVNLLLDNWRQSNLGFRNKCIGVREQKLPQSRYIKISESGRVMSDGDHVAGHRPGWRAIPGYIMFSRTRVIDRRTEEIMAESKYYFLFPSGAHYIDIASEQCARTNAWSITDIIKPDTSQ